MNQTTPVALKKPDMMDDPKSWVSFVSARIMPSTHTTEINEDKVALVYAIMTKKTVNLWKIIHVLIMRVGASVTTVGLPCARIITELCHHAGVTWGPDEQLLKDNTPIIAIDEGSSVAQG